MLLSPNSHSNRNITTVTVTMVTFPQDHGDVMKLLAFQNVDNPSLLNFVSEAADFSTGLPHTEFAVNPDNNKPDVAIFDFTSMYSAEYAAKILERRGKRLIIGFYLIFSNFCSFIVLSYAPQIF